MGLLIGSKSCFFTTGDAFADTRVSHVAAWLSELSVALSRS